MFLLPVVALSLASCNKEPEEVAKNISKITYERFVEGKDFKSVFDFSRNAFIQTKNDSFFPDYGKAHYVKTFNIAQKATFMSNFSKCNLEKLKSHTDEDPSILFTLYIEYEDGTFFNVVYQGEEIKYSDAQVLISMSKCAKELLGEEVFFNDYDNDLTKDIVFPDLRIYDSNGYKEYTNQIDVPLILSDYNMNGKKSETTTDVYMLNNLFPTTGLNGMHSDFEIGFISEERSPLRPNISEVKITSRDYDGRILNPVEEFHKSINDSKSPSIENYRKCFLINEYIPLRYERMYVIDCIYEDGDYFQFTFDTHVR